MKNNIIEQGDNWRVYIEVDGDMYDDSYIDTWHDKSSEEKRKAKEELWDRIDLDGVWGLVGEVKCPTCGSWETVDSVFGFIGNDWKDSGYDTDVLNATKEEAAARLTAVTSKSSFGEVILGTLDVHNNPPTFIFAEDGSIAARIDDDGTVRLAKQS